MAILVKNIAIGLASLIFFLGLLHIFLFPIIRHEWRAVFMRAEAVLVMETGVAICSYIFWTTLKPLPSILLSTKTVASNNDSDSVSSSLLSRRLLREKESESSLTNSNSNSMSNSNTNSSIEEQNGKLSSTPRPKQPLLWKAFLVWFILMCHVSYLTNIFLSGADPDWFSFTTYLCLGTLIQFNFGLIFIKTVSFVLCHTRSFFSGSKRRGFSQKVTTSFALLYMLFISSLGVYTASQLPPVKNVNIQLQNLTPSLQGFRIVQLSDIHLGPTVGQTRLQKVVDIVNSQRADMVVITGDLVDATARQLQEAARPLGSIISRYGTLFASGNHEYYTGDVDNWFKLLQQLNVKVLHNSNVKVPHDAQDQICFAGSDDLQADKIGYGDHHFSAADAVKGCDRGQPTILLAHQPRAARKAIEDDVGIDLVLSGHTHGGQMFPISVVVYFVEPFYMGLYHYKGSQIYVSTGTQYWGIPMRIATTMEITVITLTVPPS